MSRYSIIRKMDIVNGLGIRVSIFFSGCPFHCKGCFNSETWNMTSGKEYTEETKNTVLNLCNKEHISGLSILGGEPLIERNLERLKDLFKSFKEKYPKKDIWLWTGYLYESLNLRQLKVLEYVDVLVDGQFVLELQDFKLKYRGSSNQRVIDLNKTRENGQVTIKATN